MIRFHFHLSKIASETFALAKEVYKDDGLVVVLQVQERTADRLRNGAIYMPLDECLE